VISFDGKLNFPKLDWTIRDTYVLKNWLESYLSYIAGKLLLISAYELTVFWSTAKQLIGNCFWLFNVWK